jgi:hypothetical protein
MPRTVSRLGHLDALVGRLPRGENLWLLFSGTTQAKTQQKDQHEKAAHACLHTDGRSIIRNLAAVAGAELRQDLVHGVVIEAH